MDSDQSQVLLMSAERFGILLARNLEVGSPQTLEAENIGMTFFLKTGCVLTTSFGCVLILLKLVTEFWKINHMGAKA